MKTNLVVAGLMAIALYARAGLYEFNFDGANHVNLAIPDGNPGGLTSTLDVSGLGNQLVWDVNVYLNISGGYNGDLYSYLIGPNGTYAVLLNRIVAMPTRPLAIREPAST